MNPLACIRKMVYHNNYFSVEKILFVEGQINMKNKLFFLQKVWFGKVWFGNTYTLVYLSTKASKNRLPLFTADMTIEVVY